MRTMTPEQVQQNAKAIDGAVALAKSADSYEWNGVRFYVFRGRPCVIGADLGRYLEYADSGKRLVEQVRDEWRDDFAIGKDFDVLEGDDLREFKAVAALAGGNPVSRNARSLTVLFEHGVDLVCLRTEKPQGVALRDAVATEVLPRLRRGEAVQPSAPVPLFAPAPQSTALAPPSAPPSAAAIEVAAAVQIAVDGMTRQLAGTLAEINARLKKIEDGGEYVDAVKVRYLRSLGLKLAEDYVRLGLAPNKRSAAQVISHIIYAHVNWNNTQHRAEYLPRRYYATVLRSLARERKLTDRDLRRFGLLPEADLRPATH